MVSKSLKEPLNYKSKSIERHSIVKGYYLGQGRWTEYILNIVFDDLSCSKKIEMDYPIHGVSRNCNVLVSETGFIFIL
jgi:hypothetical protein